MNLWDGSNCKVLYEREVKLKDGTPAYELEVQWKHPSILLHSCQVVVFKDKTGIYVTCTTARQIGDDLKQYPLSDIEIVIVLKNVSSLPLTVVI